MGLSNYLPSSRLIQPGVCTSSTRPASPFEGQYIYETDTNRTLVYDGGAWVMTVDADSPPGLELVKVQTIGSAVANVTVTGAFSSTYDNYKILISGGSASVTAGVLLGMQLGSTTSGYYSSGAYCTYAGVVAASAQSNASDWTISAMDGDAIGCDVTLINPFLSKKTLITTSYYGVATGDGGLVKTGILNNTTSYTDFKLSAASGTMTGGTIRVYGYRNTI